MASTEGGGEHAVDPLAVSSPGKSGHVDVRKPSLAKHVFLDKRIKDNATSDIDLFSKMGRFGWCEVAGVVLPLIHRSCGGNFLSVRIVGKVLLAKFLGLPNEVLTCATVFSFRATEAENKLLNEINLTHCDSKYGKERFNAQDLLVKKDDVVELYKFMDLCHKKMMLKKSTESDRCGFIRIGGTSDVPYTQIDGVKYLPSFYFEGEIDYAKSLSLTGWDWAYLRFCCKVQGVKDELIVGDRCEVVPLQELRLYFAPGTSFVEYWPSKDFISRVPSKKPSRPGWTKVINNHEGNKFNGKLVPIKEFPSQQFSKDPPYKALKCMIESKVLQCINVRPYQYKEVMVTLPHLVEQLFHGFTEEEVGNMLVSQDIRLFNGNNGQEELIKHEGWEDKYVKVPLVTVKDISLNIQNWINLRMFAEEGSKRFKGI